MKSIALVFMLFITSNSLFASGSDTVFRRIENYYVTSDLSEARANPGFIRDLIRQERDVLVIKVPAQVYSEISYFVFRNFIVTIHLEGDIYLEPVWDPYLMTLVAEGDDGRLYIFSL